MKVFLTGGTGFVGNAVAARLIETGHNARALVRRGSEGKLKVADRCEIIPGSLDDSDTLKNGMEGADAVIHLVGIIKEFPKRGVTFRKTHVDGTKNAAQAAVEAGVGRFVHMSALGARPQAPTEYFRTKWEAEEFLRTLDLDLTVFRPSVIIGPSGEFTALLKQLCGAPVTPVIGDGEYKLQPVALENVADCFVNSLDEPKSVGKAYCVGGPTPTSFNDMLRVFGEVMGKKTRLAHFPKGPVKLMTRLFQNVPGWPITRDQLVMLEEDRSCDVGPISEDLKITPIDYRRACETALKK